MRTTNFVDMQMRRQPDDRVIPDRIYMQETRMHTMSMLKRFQEPWASPRVFGDGYLYGDARCFANNSARHYPNDVIPWSLVFSYR